MINDRFVESYELGLALTKGECQAMSSTSVLSCEDLRQITGYQRSADIERCLREQGINVFRGRLGPWTTVDLVNLAGGLKPAATNDDTYDPDSIL